MCGKDGAPMEIFIFLTAIMGKRVYDAAGSSVGKLVDCAADSREPYPRITCFVVKKGRRRRVRVSWDDVAKLEKKGIYLRPGANLGEPFQRLPGEVLLVEDLLDKQVVDVHGAKVERVNDIHLLNTEKDLRVVHADVGFRGLLRRLGFLGVFDAVTRWLFSYTVKERFITWRYVQPLGEHLTLSPLQLKIAQQRLATLHPADLADIIEELPQPDRAAVFKALDVETAAETLEEVEDAELAVDLLEVVGEERAGDIIEEMDPDEAADVLQEFDEEQAEKIIEDMEKERAADLRELLSQDEGTAGAIMTTECLTAKMGDRAGDVVAAFLQGEEDAEYFNYVYVVDDDDRLVGVLSLRQLLRADPGAKIATLMESRVVTVRTDDKLREVAEVFGKYGFVTVPVVDGDGRLRGMITLRDAVAAMFPDFVKD